MKEVCTSTIEKVVKIKIGSLVTSSIQTVLDLVVFQLNSMKWKSLLGRENEWTSEEFYCGAISSACGGELSLLCFLLI